MVLHTPPNHVEPMTQQDSLLVRVLKCVSLEHLGNESEIDLTDLHWWQFSQRSQVRGSVELFAGEAARAWAALPRDAVTTIARQAIHNAWWTTRQNPDSPHHSTRHPFHREVLAGDLAGLCAAVSTAAIAAASTAPWEARDLGVTPAEIPGFLDRLAPAYVREHAEDSVAQYAAVADDPRLIEQCCRLAAIPATAAVAAGGNPALVVQHIASGMRSLFWWDPHTKLGYIKSDPLSVASIDPEHPGPLNAWENVAGLGIGTLIYQRAAELLPHIRWTATSLTDSARSLRGKLHAADPWRWMTKHCTWCSTNIPSWGAAHPADFTGHPEPT